MMSNNFEGWKHINTAPKDREILVWDGYQRQVAKWNEEEREWLCLAIMIDPTHWRGCPPPPVQDDAE